MHQPLKFANSWQAGIYEPIESLERHRDLLPALAENILGRRRAILHQWRDLYVGSDVSSEALKIKREDFLHFLGDAITRNKEDLLRNDLESYASDARHLGQRLFERQLSLAQAVLLSHLFQASVLRIIPGAITPGETFRAFETLGLVRANLIAESYSTLAPDPQGRPSESERERATERLANPRVAGLVGKSLVMRRLAERVLALRMRGAATVLVVGETGTGKELVARAIHDYGPSTASPFVAVNCAALPKDLIESELFGHRKGAFSGADTDSPGLFRTANGGTLFLDEITEMPLEFQSKLLRAVQERTIRPVGSPRELPVTVRIIASTNRDPEEAIRAGQFRRDLYYRLQACVVRVPPLRERREDIALLVEHFIASAEGRSGRSRDTVKIERGALSAMMQYEWPGNVRELFNVIEAARLSGKGPALRHEDLPPAVAALDSQKAEGVPPAASHIASLHDAEQYLIQMTLTATGGNKAKAAAQLGISRKTLYAKLARYGMRDL